MSWQHIQKGVRFLRGKVVVDHERDLLYINTPSPDVGGNQDTTARQKLDTEN